MADTLKPAPPAARHSRTVARHAHTDAAPASRPATHTDAGGRSALAIDATPWCQIEIDGRVRGVTPTELPLSAGEHMVVLTNPESHVRRTLRVTLGVGETVRKKLDFSP
jgi:hypothetical protein